MALTNTVTITWGGVAYGGASASRQIDGAYIMDKAYDHMRLTFNVMLVSSTAAGRQTLAEALEVNFRKRNQTLIVNVGGTSFTFEEGDDYLNSTSSCTKSGQSQTDRGASVSYTCVVEADMPSSTPTSGLVTLESNVDFEVGRQEVLTLSGTYSATSAEVAVEGSAKKASENYLASSGALAEQTTFLASRTVDAADFEMVDEQYTYDRLDTVCQWSRQYIQVLANQVEGTLQDTAIKDHKMTFTETAQHPGDSMASIYRTRRVVGTYDCAIDITVGTDLQSVFDSKVLPHVKALFQSAFEPELWAVEDHRISYDETTKRLSCSIQFLYQKSGGSEIIEVQQTAAYREIRNIDETPIHLASEFVKYLDVGWATLERVTNRTVTAIGDMEPSRRIGLTPVAGIAGDLKFRDEDKPKPDVQKAGWNLINSTSQVTDQWLGDPDETQIKVSILVETIVERYNESPSVGTRGQR